MSVRAWVLTLAVILAGLPAQAGAQEPDSKPKDAPPAPVSDADLARVRQGLAVEHPLVVSGAIPRFYIGADAALPPPEYVQVENSPFGGGGGLDVVGLLRKAFDKWQAAKRAKKTQEARAQVQRELHALLGGPPGPPEGFLFQPSPGLVRPAP